MLSTLRSLCGPDQIFTAMKCRTLNAGRWGDRTLVHVAGWRDGRRVRPLVTMNIKRILSHLVTTHWQINRAFPRAMVSASDRCNVSLNYRDSAA